MDEGLKSFFKKLKIKIVFLLLKNILLKDA